MNIVGTGYAEIQESGRRYRFLVERYRADNGEEYGRILSKEEVPDVGPLLIIPTWGVESASEAQHLLEEWEYEKTHPNPLDVEWQGERQEQRRQMFDEYDDLRDYRAELIRRNPRTLRRS